MTTLLHGQLPWIVSRACGFGAFITFTAVAVLGLLAASGILRRLGSKRTPDVTALHRVLALVGWPLIAGHGLALLLDPWLHATPLELAWPFALHLRAHTWTGIGGLSAAALALSGVTQWLQPRLRRVPWRTVHRFASLAAYALLSAHVIGAGTDVRHGVVRFAVVQAAVLVGLMVALRLAAPRLPASRVPARS